MHMLMIVVVIAIAWCVRSLENIPQTTNHRICWVSRWQRSLFLFLFPPLLLFSNAIALLCMGSQDMMGTWHTGKFSYVFALCYLLTSILFGIYLAYKGWISVQSARNNPQIQLADQKIRLLTTGALFAGQIGFWQPELVISQGLIKSLSAEQLETVLAHEQGHHYYRDTFWFFWLGWVRKFTAWLPNTNILWQELVDLRELRADAYATSQVDPLLLAESLLLVASNPPVTSDMCCAAVNSYGVQRLEQRIEALLSPQETLETKQKLHYPAWNQFLFALLPLIIVFFHR
ncbi:M56 family metallopeptidase [Calothrix sp. PCC 6303]|uniref:M56 family metallopeptidase n=1 Tax=Calothrix sp. PCC 6303 TaxID=1170562 RepID=UPI0002A023B1|nr:M56 family metallopeptidase [Calothrix sp. PCC 6303]AFZ03174.1 peptidase M48 Ste24p [Calothrix sp. PCC 6303]